MELASDLIAAQRSSRDTAGRNRRVALFLGTTVCVALIESLLAFFLPRQTRIPLPWFLPAAVAFYFGAGLSISVLCFVRKEPYAFWVGSAFCVSAFFNLSYLVFPEASHGSAAAYIFYLSYFALLCPTYYLFTSGGRPKLRSWRSLAVNVAAISLFAAVVAGSLYLFADRLPELSLGARTTLFSQVLPYVFFALYLGATSIQWLKIKQTGDRLVGYVCGVLVLCLWVFPAVLRSSGPYDIGWFLYHLFPAVTFLLFYLALLFEYLDLYREFDSTLNRMKVTHQLNTLVSESLSLEEICRQLSHEIRNLVPYDRLAVNLLEKSQKYFKVYSEESALPYSAIPEGISFKEGTATGLVIDRRQPLVCGDLLQESRFPVTSRRYGKLGLRSFVILPLIGKGQVLGALNLAAFKPNQYSQKEIDTLTPVAEILSLAVEKAHLYSESQRHVEIQSLLKEVSQDITSLNVNNMLEKLTRKVCEVLNVDVSDVRLMVEGDWYSLGISGLKPGSEPVIIGSGLRRSRWVIEHRRPVVVEDMLGEASARQSSRSAPLGFRGYAGIPLCSRGGEVIGVLRCLTYQPRQFTQEEIDLLQQLANGAAIAIENARLFDEVRHKSRDLESTNARLDRLLREQTAMREVFSQINLLDVDDLLRQLTEHALVLLSADQVQVVLLRDDQTLRTVCALGKGADLQQGRVRPLGQGRASWVMENRRPLAIKDMSVDPAFGGGPLVRKSGMKGFLGIPLISRRQESIGLLVATTLAERAFSEDEIAVAQQFAAGAAIAIENAHLLEQAIEKSLHLEALIKVNRDVASPLKRDVLLPRIADQARKFLGVDGASFRLVENGSLVRAAYAGDDDISSLAPVIALGESVTGKIVRENRVIAVRNVLEDDRIIEVHRRILTQAEYRSFLGVPLRLGDSVIGTINLYSKDERAFLPEEIQLITAFADQAAIAIENARLFEEVQKKSAELEDSFKLKSEFFNTMAHELRTPLNVVIGTEQLLVDGSYGDLTQEQHVAIARIGRYAEDLLELINEILDLMRLEAKKVPLHCEEFSVRDITDDLEVAFDPLVRAKGLTLNLDIDHRIPLLRSDRAKVREILQNILANAVKYTDHGAVELRVALETTDGCGENGRVSWSVRDTGIGIHESALAHLFEPFYMADGVDRRKYPGTGLGLSIVKRLVELLDGAMKVESEVGRGTTFTVTIPLAHEEG